MAKFFVFYLNLHLKVFVILSCFNNLIAHVIADSACSKVPSFSGKDISHQVFESENDELFPVTYIDFNSDKLTDMITVSRDHSSISIYFGSKVPPLLRQGPSCNLFVSNKNTTSGKIIRDKVNIVGVAPGDFTGDGLVDIVVTFTRLVSNTTVSYTENNISNTPEVEVIIFEGNQTNLICNNRAPVNEKQIIKMVQEPLVLDFNGDMVMDLLGEIWEPVNSTQTNQTTVTLKRRIWIFNSYDKLVPKPADFIIIDSDEEFSYYPMAIPSSNAFVDVDGDSVPELVLLTTTSRVPYYHNMENRIQPENNEPTHFFREAYHINILPNGSIAFTFAHRPIVIDAQGQTQVIGQSLFIDLNQSGELIHLLPYCSQLRCHKKNGIKAIHNKNVYDLPIQFVDRWIFIPMSLQQRIGSNYTSSVVLRAGDYNLDGFPDLIGTLVNIQDVSTPSPFINTRAVIFENVPCIPDFDQPPCDFARTFRINYVALGEFKNVTLATFYDLHDDGLVDIILVRRNNTESQAIKQTYEIKAVQNNPSTNDYKTNMGLKVLVVSTKNDAKNDISYGNIISGPVIRYQRKTTEQTAVAAQMYRSSYMPMDFPYIIFGLGNSSQFIETLHISASPSLSFNRSHDWLKISPNSEIFVVPSPLNNPAAEWKSEIITRNGAIVVNTFGLLISLSIFSSFFF